MESIKEYNQVLQTFWPEWTLEYEIGVGSHGTVYQAVCEKDHSTAAIKIISVPQSPAEITSLLSEGNNELSTRAYFLEIVNNYINEIRLMDQLRDEPNIIAIQDYQVVEHKDEIGWDIFIRMELLTSFLDYYNDEKPPQSDIIRLGMDICQALCACSRHHIIHRDIKPENIFVDNQGRFKLGDFGIARRLDRYTSSLTRTGTYNYMAPEVFKSLDYSENVDIYSLGIVLYRYTNNNHLPFLNTEKQLIPYNERTEAFERRISGEELPAPANASPAFAALILKACRYHPEERFANADEMLRALKALQSISEEGSPAVRRFVAKCQRRPIPRKRNQAVTAAIIIAAAVATAAIVSSRQPALPDTDPGIVSADDSYVSAEDLGRGKNYVSWEESGVTDHVMVWHDEQLETALRKEIGRKTGDVMLSDLWLLQDLTLDDLGIRDLTDLAELTNLYSLSLNDNEISDLHPLESLVHMETLYLDNNQISDLTPLAGMSELEMLSLKYNQIHSIAPLASLTKLERLMLSYNTSIEDISALKDLIHLKTLYMQQTGISDPSVLGNLKELTSLDLIGNKISDISSLKDLSQLYSAEFSDNQITDISVVTNWPELHLLYLNDNQITDITPLAECDNLEILRIKNNPIRDYSTIEDRAYVEKDF